MEEHKKRYFDRKVKWDEYCYGKDKYSIDYNPTTWWLHDSAFCKYIQYKNAKMALPLMTAVQALSKRALSQTSYNHKVSPIIYDGLNQFVKYTLASWNVVHQLTKHSLSIPMQLDFTR